LLEVFEDENGFYMVMEYASSGDLLSLIRETGALPE
jgi:serine/threonine protein kinase